MRKLSFVLFLIASVFLFCCKSKPGTDKANVSKQNIDWVHQVDSLLMPFWMTDEAYGEPFGNFPNYRYNDGKIISYDNFDFSSIPAIN